VKKLDTVRKDTNDRTTRCERMVPVPELFFLGCPTPWLNLWSNPSLTAIHATASDHSHGSTRHGRASFSARSAASIEAVP
jgi:hypothetical protein